MVTIEKSECALSFSLILPANGGHPVKRVHYATEVNHDKGKAAREEGTQTIFRGIQA
jgi:hypothetical protein